VEREVQPVSVAGSKAHCMSQWARKVLLPASSAPVLGPHVPIPPPAQPSGCSTRLGWGRVPSRAGGKRFCW